MFKNDGDSGDLNGFLDAGSHIQGDLHFEDTFRVDGKLDGKISSSGSLVVGEGGEVEGEVAVARVFVSGSVRGSIRATERVEITSAGRVEADLETPSLIVEDGAFFRGMCSMTESGKEGPRVAKPSLMRAVKGTSSTP